MKRVFLVHCWKGYPEYCWYPYVKRELETRGFEVKVPAFPDTDNPRQNKWVPCLAEQIGTPDENVFLVGHSIGVATILRYLETMPEDKKIGGAVLVAGFTAIHSDNDPYVDLKFSKIFKEKLGAEVIVKHALGHFSGSIEGEPACTELPVVLEKILEMAK